MSKIRTKHIKENGLRGTDQIKMNWPDQREEAKGEGTDQPKHKRTDQTELTTYPTQGRGESGA